MKCHLERDWMNRRVKVWLYREGPSGMYVLTPDGIEELVPADTQLPEPTLELREEALQALAAAASGILPASDATTAHLQDAMGVRDRLLTMVEETHGAGD